MPRCPKHAHIELEPKKKGWYCEECDSSALSYEQLPRDGVSPVVSGELPTLLAIPWSEFIHESHPVLAMWAACDFAEMTLKLCVMAGLAEHNGKLPESLLHELRDRVDLPTLGKWLGMAQAVVRHSPIASVLPLDDTVCSISRLLESDGLLRVRNRLAHGGPVSKAEAENLRAVWHPLLTGFVTTTLQWLTQAQLIAVDQNGQRFLLRGERGTEATRAPVPVDDKAVPGSAWLVMGDRSLNLGPLSAFDPEHRNLLVYVRRGEVRLQYLRMGDESGLCDSDIRALNQFQQLFAINSMESGGPRGFTVRSFDAEIRKEATRRIGREKELVMLNRSIAQLERGCLWVGGPAGIGKSNLMAAAMEHLLDNPTADRLVLPYRFRAGDDRCGRSPFLAFLRERLEKSEWVVELVAKEGEERKTSPTADPVSEVRQLLERLRDGARVLLLLDGLDEMAERDPTFLGGVLQPLVLDTVLVVGAGRSERGIPEWFRRRGAVEPFAHGLPPMSEDDVRALLLERTGPVRKRLLVRDKESGATLHNAFIARVAKRSEGLPIYVNYVIGDLNTGKLGPENIDALPESLHAYHDELLRRASVGDLQAVTTPLLVLLALANEPLTPVELATLLKRRGVLETADIELVERVLAYLASMLRRGLDPDGEEGYTLFHHSLREHVIANPELRQTVGATRKSLAEASIHPQGDAAEIYLFRNGVRHLLSADRRFDALAIQTHFELLMRRFQRLEFTGRVVEEWYADWERLRSTKFEGDDRVWWDFARTNRHHFQKEGWEPWRVLFQAAMDHAEDSVVTLAAEKFSNDSKVSWSWIRWVNRPKKWQESALIAVLSGHTDSVNGVEVLPDGRILSWSDDCTLRLWDGDSGAPLAVLEGHTDSIEGVHILPDGRILSWSDDCTLRLWDGASGAPLAVLEGHTDSIEDVHILPDGRILSWAKIGGAQILQDWRILSLSPDCTLRLWDGASGAPLAVLEGHTHSIKGVQILPGGRILSWSTDHTLRLWDGASGIQFHSLEGHTDSVNGVEVLSDGRILSWANWRKDKSLRLWDGTSGLFLADLKGHTASVNGAQVLPDGRILSWSTDHTLRLWDGVSGAPLAILEGHTHSITGVQILPDGRILSWSRDHTLHLWDGASGAHLAVLEGHTGSIEGVHIVSNGRILSWALDYTLRLWSEASGALLATFEGHTGCINGVQVIPDGRILSWSVDHTLRLWSESSSLPLGVFQGHTASVNGAQVLPDGRILSWSSDCTTLIWDGAVGAQLSNFEEHTASVSGVLALKNARALSWARSWGKDNTLRLWDTVSGVLIVALEGHTGSIDGVRVVPHGRILSWSRDYTLRLWSETSGASLATFEGHTGRINGVHVLPNGRILSWSDDHTLRLWDVASGAALATFEGHTGSVSGVQVLPDGRLLSWSDDYAVHLWDEKSGALLSSFEGHTGRINGVEVFSDGRILSWTDDHTLRLWDGASGATLATFEGHTGRINGVHVLPNGRILSWSDDHTLRLWDGASGAAIAAFEGHTGLIYGVQALPDGRIQLLSDDYGLHLWDEASGALLVVLEGHTKVVYDVDLLPDGKILTWDKWPADNALRLWDVASGKQLYVWSVPYDWERGPDVAGTEGSVRSQMRQHRLEDGEVRDVSGKQVVLTCGRHVRICQWVQASNIGEQNLM
jgi:WD40 repeat protein